MFAKLIEQEKPRKSRNVAQDERKMQESDEAELVPDEDPFICS